MACGILLVTHPGIGASILSNAGLLLRPLPLKAEAFDVPLDADLEALLPLASAAMRRVDGGDGVLVLTDMFGGTPTNMSLSLLGSGQLEVLTGVNLPMLLEVLSRREGLSLEELAGIGATAGQGGICRVSTGN